jgi:glycosyltransferase involved in cell wall biosynthesis
VVFVQKSPHKAGAQACLARLITHALMKPFEPVLVTSAKGWLADACRREGVPVIEEPFPSSRSIAGRVIRNRLFAARVKRRLLQLGRCPSIVHANDHAEGLLALALSRCIGAKSAMFLRSFWMTRRDYFKYRCHDFELVCAVGDDLHQRAGTWDTGKKIGLIHDGLYRSEVCPPKQKPAVFPDRLLVIGTSARSKGWPDFTDALSILQQKMNLPFTQVDFTGTGPDPASNELKLHRLKGLRFNFVGKVEDFKGFVRNYDLVVNPSRGESFGMAALEVLAAGVPLLSSRTGVIGQVIERGCMLFDPNDPQSLADSLKYVIANWPALETEIEGCQERILLKFDIGRSAESLSDAYEKLLRS